MESCSSKIGQVGDRGGLEGDADDTTTTTTKTNVIGLGTFSEVHEVLFYTPAFDQVI